MEGMTDRDKGQFAELMAMLEVSCLKYARKWQPDELKLRNRTYWAALHDFPLWAVQAAVQDVIKYGAGEFPSPSELRSKCWLVPAFREEMAKLHRQEAKRLIGEHNGYREIESKQEISLMLADLGARMRDKDAEEM